MSDIRVGVVGIQGIGVAHLFAIAGLGEAYTTTAVCDVDEPAVQRTAQDFDATAFTDAEDLFASGLVDAVVLAVPPFLHGPLTAAALDHGLHVLCEKPMTPLASDGVDLAAAARRADRVVQIGYQHRFQASYERARELLTEGALGTVFRATMVSTRWFRPRRYFTAKPWRARWATVGGGVLLSQATHTLDAFVWLAGLPERVRAEAWRSLHDSEVEQEVTALLTFPGGARGTLTASTVDPVGRNRIELHGTRGTLVADGYGLRAGWLAEPIDALLDGDEDFAEVPVTWETLVPAPDNEQAAYFELLQACHRDFLAAIRGEGPPRNDPVEANRAVELANAVYLSAVTDEPVTLPLDHAAYRAVFDDLCEGRASIPVAGGGAG